MKPIHFVTTVTDTTRVKLSPKHFRVRVRIRVRIRVRVMIRVRV